MNQAFLVGESRSQLVANAQVCLHSARTPYSAAPFWQLLPVFPLYMTRVATPRESKLQLICGCLASSKWSKT